MPAGLFCHHLKDPADVKRLSVPLTDKQHQAIKVRAAETGLPLTQIVRRLLFAWLRGELEVPEGRRADRK